MTQFNQTREVNSNQVWQQMQIIYADVLVLTRIVQAKDVCWYIEVNVREYDITGENMT